MTTQQELEAIRETLIRNCYGGDFANTAKRSTLSLLYGTLGHLVPLTAEQAEKEFAEAPDEPLSPDEIERIVRRVVDPKPAPLPHEWVPSEMAGERVCFHCGAGRSFTFDALEHCPARNEPPADKAEALPEIRIVPGKEGE